LFGIAGGKSRLLAIVAFSSIPPLSFFLEIMKLSYRLSSLQARAPSTLGRFLVVNFEIFSLFLSLPPKPTWLKVSELSYSPRSPIKAFASHVPDLGQPFRISKNPRPCYSVFLAVSLAHVNLEFLAIDTPHSKHSVKTPARCGGPGRGDHHPFNLALEEESFQPRFSCRVL